MEGIEREERTEMEEGDGRQARPRKEVVSSSPLFLRFEIASSSKRLLISLL